MVRLFTVPQAHHAAADLTTDHAADVTADLATDVAAAPRLRRRRLGVSWRPSNARAGSRRSPLPPRDRLIFALDVPDVDRAAALIDALGDAVTFYKVGLELILSRGLRPRARPAARSAASASFVDGKLYDVPQTVERRRPAAGRPRRDVHDRPRHGPAARGGLPGPRRGRQRPAHPGRHGPHQPGPAGPRSSWATGRTSRSSRLVVDRAGHALRARLRRRHRLGPGGARAA